MVLATRSLPVPVSPETRTVASLLQAFEIRRTTSFIAEEEKIITIGARDENQSQARFASLDKNIIEPLEKEWGFIEIEKIGRNRWIKITEEGQNAAEFLI